MAAAPGGDDGAPLASLLASAIISSSSSGTGAMNDTAPPLPGLPPIDRGSCSLLGTVALVVQALMAVIVLSSLVIKRYRENPPRRWPVWLADVSKQVIGQGFLHSSNVLISTLFSHGERRRDACTAYFLSIFVDCTLGVLVIFAAMRMVHMLAVKRWHWEGCRSGQYYASAHAGQSSQATSPKPNSEEVYSDDVEGAPPVLSTATSSTRIFQFKWWAKQLGLYLLVLCVMKIAIIGFFWIPSVFSAGDWILSWLGEESKIVFVLMLFPLAMNAMQVGLKPNLLIIRPH